MNAALELPLLNDYQHDLPLVAAPFAAMAAALGVSEEVVLQSLRALQQQGKISRVGAVFRPRSIGASTLAALAVPEARLDSVAEMVSSYPEVNHNYQREHHYNLWFVVTAPDEVSLQRVLKEIEERAGSKVLFLPLVEDYHIDLGFDLTGARRKRHHSIPEQTVTYHPTAQERAVIGAIQTGLPLVSRPFAKVAESVGMDEQAVIDVVDNLIRQGVIKRMGVVVRHHELGYRANAMVVWDVPDDAVTLLGQMLGKLDYVTLCYRRPRRLPAWRYNLFCMIHGHDRAEVLARVAEMSRLPGLENLPHDVLFSTRRFKQCGARYAQAAA